MKKFFLDKDKIADVTAIFSVLTFMVLIAFYYLINLPIKDVEMVKLSGYIFVAIAALIVVIHAAFAKRVDVLLLSIGYLFLGGIGTACKILTVVDVWDNYNTMMLEREFLFSITYAFSTIFAYAMIDKVCIGKRLLSKWWFAGLITILTVGSTVALYRLPFETITKYSIDLITYGLFAVIYLLGLVAGIVCIAKKKSVNFSWAYCVYTLLTAAAFCFQVFANATWSNRLLMVALTVAPFALWAAVKCEE